MNAGLRKEIRLLLPAWGVAMALAAVPFQWLPRPATPIDIDFGWGNGIAFALGILLLAVSVFGREIAGGMWKTILSQPVSRKVIWKRKLAVFAAGAVLVWLVFWLSSGMGERFSWRLGTASLAVAAAIGGTGFVTTLLFRQALPAFAFSLLLPSLLVPVLGPMADKGFPSWIFGAAVLAVGGYAIAAFRWSFGLLATAEDLGPWLGDLTVSAPWRRERRGREHVAGTIVTGRPVRSLLAKEWRLQRVNLVCGVTVLLLALVVEVILSDAERSETGDGFRTMYSLLILLLPLLAGAVAIAEERRLGLLTGMRLLPVSTARQLCIKLVVTFGVALSLGVLLPALVSGAAASLGGITAEGGGMEPAVLAQLVGVRLLFLDSRIGILAAYALTATAVSLFASSITRSMLGALVLAVVLLGGGGMTIIIVQELWAGGSLWTWVCMVTGVLVCAGLACGNFRAEIVDRRIFGRNFAVIVAGGALATGLTAATFYRTWELFLADPTAAIDAAEPLLKDGADIYQMPGSSRWLVHLPDGRLWAGNGAREGAQGVSFPEDGEFLETRNWAKIGGSSDEICGIRQDGSLWRIFGRRNGFVMEPLADGEWIDLAGGRYHLLAIRKDGTLWGWGWNWAFRLEQGGTTSYVGEPERVGEDADWARILASRRTSLGTKKDGSAWVRYGKGWSEFRRFPSVGSGFRNVAGRFESTLGVGSDGTLWHWWHWRAQALHPKRLGDRSDWKAAVPSWGGIVALDQSGNLWTSRRRVENPTKRLSGESGWVAILTNDDGIYALARDGSFWVFERPERVSDGEYSSLLAPSRWARRVAVE